MKLVHLAGIAAGAWLLARRNTGAIGAIVPDKCVGVTQCADGTWSTLPADRRGVCTHHGGIAEGYRRRVVKEETGEAVDVIEVIDEQGQAVDVVEVPIIGQYRFTAYTTQKGKTAPAIAIKFSRKPQREILDTLRNSKFWWNRADGQWYGWETPENLEVVESLPVAMEGEAAPVVSVEDVEEAKSEWPEVGQYEDYTDGTGQMVWVSVLDPVEKTYNGAYPITIWKNRRNNKHYVSSGHATVNRKVVQKYAKDGEPDNLVSFGLNEWKQPVETETPESLTTQEKTAFKIDPPARGRLYSNAEYSELKTLLSAQSMWNRRISGRAFPEIRQLWKEIVAFDNWGLKNFPKWPALFSDQPGYYAGKGSYVPDITQRNSDHPAGLLKHYVDYAYDRFRNQYNLSEERFNEYRNRNHEDVQAFFTKHLSEAIEKVRERIQLLKNPFWFDPDADPQEKIDAGVARDASSKLMGRILYIIHDINPEEHWISNEKFNGWKYSKYDLLSGKIRLNDYLAAIERRKAEYEARNDQSALRLKKDIGELYEFNREYLEKGYSYHLPTYSRKIREAGVGILGEKKYYASGRSSESYIEVHPADRQNGIRIMLSIIPGYEVESILIATAVIHECFKGKMSYQDIYFKCYSGSRTYPEVKKYLEGEEPIELLYGLEPAISGYWPIPPQRTASFFI